MDRKLLWRETLQNTILLRKLTLLINQSKSKIDLLKKEAYPDLSISGYYSKDTGIFQEQRIGVGISIPLPLFDRNQHSVMSAQNYAKSLNKEAEYAREILQRDFNSAFEEYLAARQLIVKFSIHKMNETDIYFNNLLGEFIKGRLELLTFLEVEAKIHQAHISAYLSQQSYVHALLQIFLISGKTDFAREF